jgi:hypothetical protein
MSIVVCQEKNTYLHYFIFPLNFPGLLKSEGGQDFRPSLAGKSASSLAMRICFREAFPIFMDRLDIRSDTC